MHCRGGKSKLRERTGSVLQFHGRIMFESSAIVNDASAVLSKFSSYFGMSFFVTGAIFGDVAASLFVAGNNR